MKKFLLIAIALIGISTAAFADALDDARANGLVGETPSGYLAAVSNTPQAKQLVSSINAARKAEYQKIAAKNNQSLDVVEKLAAAKLIVRSAPGSFVMDSSGNWIKK